MERCYICNDFICEECDGCSCQDCPRIWDCSCVCAPGYAPEIDSGIPLPPSASMP